MKANLDVCQHCPHLHVVKENLNRPAYICLFWNVTRDTLAYVNINDKLFYCDPEFHFLFKEPPK